MNFEETSRLLGVTPGTMRGWVSQKKVPYVKIGRLTKFDPNDIEKWIQERKVKPFES